MRAVTKKDAYEKNFSFTIMKAQHPYNIYVYFSVSL